MWIWPKKYIYLFLVKFTHSGSLSERLYYIYPFSVIFNLKVHYWDNLDYIFGQVWRLMFVSVNFSVMFIQSSWIGHANITPSETLKIVKSYEHKIVKTLLEISNFFFNIIFMIVVHFNQLLGAAPKTGQIAFFTLFIIVFIHYLQCIHCWLHQM